MFMIQTQLDRRGHQLNNLKKAIEKAINAEDKTAC